ncbi:alcohol dehydrogenase [Ophiocordyceps camponoti-floridani]|uniref:Alcohol dehydrogenase n=1 Tax=Ophiocordyceps camponoti-floridani TaxID=2030778 RepID=A0A8H4VAC2_9HYPO|nr:alcohol dehydrogenase [Ophiocordyceps camponoti-floridani]
MTPSPDEARVRVAADDMIRLVDQVLQAHGTPSDKAALVARCLVAADIRGVDSHGASRLPSYVRRIRSGVLDPAASPIVETVTPAAVRVDGANGFGFVAAHAAMNAAISAARVYGIGIASVRRSNHYGMAAWIVRQALDEGMMSLVFTNSSPAMAPFGGRSRLLGVSPMACGAPGRDGDDFILDMAPSVVARGKIHTALRRGESIPSDWALDAQGNPTSDPAAALDGGVMLPVGGPKGSALAIMMDVFSGVLSGSAFAGDVTGPYDPSRPANVGHFLVAIRPDLFMPLDEFRDRMRILYERVVGAEPVPGLDRVYFPGEREQLMQRERERSGVPLVGAEVEALNREAAEVSVEPLKVL